MAATITKGYTFGATELVTNTKLHTLVDSATISGIANTELSTITLVSMVNGNALFQLGNIPSGAGIIPNSNLPIYSGNTTTADNTAAGSITINIDGVDYRILYA